MLKVIKIGAALVIGVSAILGTTSFPTEAVSKENALPCETICTFSVPSDGMTAAEKQEYFSALTADKKTASFKSGTSISYKTESDLLAEKYEKLYPIEKVQFTPLPKPTDNMTDEEKKAYFSSLINQAKIPSSSATRDGSPPSLSDFHNLDSSGDYNAYGEFTANYLYTLKCFDPNLNNNLIIDGWATAEPAATKMYICMYDVTTGTAGTQFTINYSTMSANDGSSYFDFSFAIGPLNSNHMYAIGFSSDNVSAENTVSFTVSHS